MSEEPVASIFTVTLDEDNTESNFQKKVIPLPNKYIKKLKLMYMWGSVVGQGTMLQARRSRVRSR
jgi:hypothetical protein